MAQQPHERLNNILWWGQILGNVQPSGGLPVVCFTESNGHHLQWLLSRGWPPWAVIFQRQAIYDVGGDQSGTPGTD